MSCLAQIQNWIQCRFRGKILRQIARLAGMPVFWCLLLTIVCSFMYHPIYNPRTFPSYYYVGADTNGYTQYEMDLWKGEFEINRTPVYPMFLKFVYWVTGSESILDEVEYTPEGTPVSDHIVQGETTCFYVVCLQMLLFWLVLIPFYYACGTFLRDPVVHFTAVLMIAIAFLPYQWWILTESLSISGSLLFFSLIVFYLNRPTHTTAVSLGLLTFFLVLLRPIFLYLVILLFFFWILRLCISSHDRKEALAGFLALLVSLAGLYGYAGLNEKNHGFRTISPVSLTNRFIMIFQTDFYLKSKDTEVLEYIEKSPLNVKASKYLLFEDLADHFGYKRVKQFVHGTIRANLKEFIISHIKRMWWESDLYAFRPLYFFGAFDLLITILLGIWLKTFPWLRLGMWGFFFGIMFTMYFGGIDCYERLILPALPVLYLLLARYADILAIARTLGTQETLQYLKETA